jgi:phosphohistidine phosphatase
VEDGGVTHRLLVVRHASTSAAPPTRRGTDHDRTLDGKGKRQLPSIRDGVREFGQPLDVVLASTAARVRQTVAGMLPADFEPANISWFDQLYLADVRTLFTVLRAVSERHQRVAVCGHNPGLHELALDLVGDQAPGALAAGFPTGAMAAFDIDVAWAELVAGAGRLVNLRAPKRSRDA